MERLNDYVEQLARKWSETTGRSPKYVKGYLEYIAMVAAQNLSTMSPVQLNVDDAVKRVLEIYVESRCTPGYPRHPCRDLHTLALTALLITLEERGIDACLDKYPLGTAYNICKCYWNLIRRTGKHRDTLRMIRHKCTAISRKYSQVENKTLLDTLKALVNAKELLLNLGMHREAEAINNVITRLDKTVRA